MFSARTLVSVAATAVLVLGCVTGEKITRVEPGMSKAEVIDILGRPDGYWSEGEYEALQYTNRLISGWSWDRADYGIILKSGRVTGFGAGHVRQGGPNMSTFIIIPLR